MRRRCADATLAHGSCRICHEPIEEQLLQLQMSRVVKERNRRGRSVDCEGRAGTDRRIEPDVRRSSEVGASTPQCGTGPLDTVPS